MKKLFFFRSSPSDNVETVNSPPADDEKNHHDNPSEIGEKWRVNDKNDKRFGSLNDMFSISRKPLLKSESSAPTSRRSLSFSSPSYESSGPGERNMFSSHRTSTSPTNSLDVHRHLDHPVWCHSTTPERQQSEVVDLYIDGEQQQERNLRPGSSSYQRRPTVNGKGSARPPPKIQSTIPASPRGFYKEKLRSFLFREMRDSYLRLSTKNESDQESPQKFAKNVVNRLSEVLPQKSITVSSDFDHDASTTGEDIFEEYLERHHVSNSDKIRKNISPCASPNRTIIETCVDESSGILQQNHSRKDVFEGMFSVHTKIDEDFELHRKAKGAVERVTLLSEELEPEICLQENNFSLSSLIKVIRTLAESKRSLALEVSTQLQCRISERASSKEALRVAKMELDSKTRRLEKEKVEMQSELEKELDRRSSDWSFKLEKIQLEEQRLRERVRELAEQNVSLQRKVSSRSGREMETNSRINHSELQLKDVRTKLEELSKENQDLERNLLDAHEQFKGAEEDQWSIQRSFKEKEKENKELQKAIARLQRTCSEQEKTICGLRQGLGNEIERNVDNHECKLQMEQVRLTGVEQSLRREVDSYRLEVEHLRHENVNLLDRLRCSSNNGGSLFFKLDQELQARVDCLQKQGLQLFSESNQLCAKMLELIKTKGSQHFEGATGFVPSQVVNKNGLDGYFLVEADMKVQSLRRGLKNLTRSLQTVTSSLHAKSKPVNLGPQPQIIEGTGSGKPNSQALEDNTELELRAETLLTNLLREKLLAKRLEIDQLQAELATAIRGHDILQCEAQSALDALSCASHKMKDIELQMRRKEETINRLQNDLQECSKELKITKGILRKVSEERDLMWGEVKQYSENNMLLNSEVNSLKKRTQALDEELLLQDGQIAILKDSLEKKPFDIFSSPRSFREFRLD